MKTLFSKTSYDNRPLSYRLRPKKIEDFVGQENLLGSNGILKRLIENEKINNCIFYGPPGVGKTTLASIISNHLSFEFENLNATTSGINEIKEVASKAKQNLEVFNRRTILFLDEIHRFNKLQQDSLLSYTEDGTLILIGATTENPYYNLNNALLSRVMIFEFKSLTRENIKTILINAINEINISVDEDVIETILDISSGDARIALNYLELYKNSIDSNLEKNQILTLLNERKIAFHKKEDKYNMISAFIKSMRGSDPDATIYWLARLLDGGEDPRYIARRICILASEDVGLANIDAMNVANATLKAAELIGMPEIRIILAEAAIYMAISSKSNSAYLAINSALKDIKDGNIQEVPENICHDNVGYLYPHDYKDNFVGQKYMLNKKKYYFPKNNRNELLIHEKLKKLWKD